MKLSSFHFENLSSSNFWPKYHNRSVAILAVHPEKWATIMQEGGWDVTLKSVGVFVDDSVGHLVGYWFSTRKAITKCSGVDLIEVLIAQYLQTPVFLWGARAKGAKNAAASYRARMALEDGD